MQKKKICLIKAGSAVVTRKDGTLDLNTMQDIGKTITLLIKEGWSPILVSSGASSAGKGFLGSHKIDKDIIKPLTASIGQSNLIAYYINLLKLSSPKIQVAQLLINRRNLTNYNVYNYVKKNITAMLLNNILPIINENDVLWEDEVCFSDNDHLASVIAGMLNVDTVLLFSDIDGVYNKNPKIYNGAEKIINLSDSYKDWNVSIDDSNVSNGGMKSKLDVFKKMSILGIDVHLMSKHILNESQKVIDMLNVNIFDDGTHLLCQNKKNFSDYKRWLLSSSTPKGIVIISEKGASALSQENNTEHRTNLYCIGVQKFYGKFDKGDIVTLRDEKFNLIGFGKTSYSFEDLIAKKCREGRVFIHDDFFINTCDDFFVSRDKELIEQYVNNLKNIEGYRVKSNKPLIVIDNQKKGSCKKNSADIDEIIINQELTSNIKFEAKQACKKLSITFDDWIIFSVFLEKR